MPARDRILAIGARTGERIASELGNIARERRMALGLSRHLVAAKLGISRSTLARWEAAVGAAPDLRRAARLLRLLGLDLTLRAYPAGGALRDQAHTRLISRFVRLIGTAIPFQLEAPIPLAGDLRAWDVLMTISGSNRVGVAAETRLRDWQALLRAERLKARDSGVDRLILVLANTVANREAVRMAGATLATQLPLDGRTILAALRAGRDPGGDGILFV
jgi:transcriptional regulator with XRE-family HTH domain